MSQHFDPLHRWLGIRPEEQPPNHYRLLGIAQFEDDTEVIRDAAERQMAHVRTYGLGQHSDLSQTVLNQLSRAKSCLLNATDKADYDRELRKGIEASQTEESAVNPTLSVPGPKLDASPAPQRLQTNSLDIRAQRTGRGASRARTTKRRRDKPWSAVASLIPIVFGGVGGICVAIVLLWVVWKKDPLGIIEKGDTSQRAEKTSEPDRRVAEIDQSAAHRKPSNKREERTEAEPREQKMADRSSSAAAENPPVSIPSDPSQSERPDAPPPRTIEETGELERDESVEDGSPPAKSLDRKPPANTPIPPDEHPPALAKSSAPGPNDTERHPVPQGDTRESAVSQVKDIFQGEYAAANEKESRIRLAKLLQEEAQTIDDDIPMRFALLHEGYLQAVAAGDITVSLELAEQLLGEFELDNAAVYGEVVENVSRNARTAEERAEVCTVALALSKKLSDAAQHEGALQIANLAYSLVTRTRDTTLRKRAKSIRDAVEKQHRQWATAQKAKAVLAESPNDAMANLAYGRYLCLVEQDWDNGLVMLAKGSDVRLGALAKEDLTEPQEVARQIALADHWYEFASSDDSLKDFYSRAHFWYKASDAQAADLDKLKVQKRLQGLSEYDATQEQRPGMRDGREVESKLQAKPLAASPTVTPSPTQILTSDQWMWSTPRNLGPAINTDGWESGPSLSPDGLTLLFVSDRPGGCGGRDLWMTTRLTTEAPWRRPLNLGPSINSPSEERTGPLLDDNCTLFFSSDRPGGGGSYDIWTSRRKTRLDPWGRPMNLGPIINTESGELVASLTPDGLTMFFSSGRLGGIGGGDIWMSKRPSQTHAWGEAKNLGPMVNADSLEGGGWITSDGLTLLFGGRPPGSQKEYLLWMATRSKTDQPFGQRCEIKALDSPGADGGPTLSTDGRELFFHSNRSGGRGGWDLWTSRRIQRP